MQSLWSSLDPVVKIIAETPAHDLAGLALKANATATTWPSLWEHAPEELDHEERLLRNLIENICAVAGVDLVAMEYVLPRDWT